MKLARLLIFAQLGLSAVAPSWAQGSAQNYPEKPIRIIVSSAAGGYLDIISRALAKELSAQWNQPIIIDNRPGASGAIGATLVQKADPDGYTWLAATEAHLVTNKFTQKNLPYDFHRDFVGVSLLTKADQVVVATTSFPVNTLPELIEMARKQKLNYGSWGIGSHPHLFYSKLGSLTKTEFTMVPYKGVAPVIQALRAEEVPLSVMSVGTARPLIDAGRVKVLAAAAKQRTPEFPNVPTTGELGLQGLESSIFMVFLMPRATPTAIVDKASSAVQAIMRRPDFATPNVTSKGFQVIASDPKGVTAAVDELTPLVADSIKAANITPD